jgi:glutamine amidotransferase
MAGIVVVDYHKGNLLSVAHSFADAGAEATVTDDPAAIRAASGVVLPGVGSFEDAMLYMDGSGQADAVRDVIAAGVPFLGICIGLHLLFERGDERLAGYGPGPGGGLDDAEPVAAGTPGEARWVAGLGILPGSVLYLNSDRLKVPHVGWDQAHLTEHGRACPLFAGVPEGANFYFTHSYALADDVPDALVAARCHYVRSFPCAVWHDNVFGLQFHPEKSSATGLAVLRNFVGVVEGRTAA